MALEGMQIGDYRLLRLIGSGGMSEVYFAEDTRIPRQVAVKVVRGEATPYPNTQATQETARLFEREMKAITSLDHPNILPLYDFGEETINATTVTYMVMPFRSEGSLVDWLYQHRRTGALPPQEVGYLVQEAANALQHAHNHHLMHLDVKPSNFLIRFREDRPQLPDLLLTDFGISRFSTATSTASQSIRGTPTYMAPEQWTGHSVPATDQYALAIMAYQLLTGIPPFQGTMHNMMYLHLQVQPPPPSSIHPQLPAAVDAVILRALAKSPQDRFPSVLAFAQALQQAFQNIVQREEDNPTLLAQSQKTLFSPPNPFNSEEMFALSPSAPTAPSSRLIRDIPYASAPGVKLSQTAQPQRASWGTCALISLLALILMVGSVGVTIYLVRSTPSNSSANDATATATALANYNATMQANGEATAQANVTATAYAVATASGIAANSYPSYLSGSGTLAFYDLLSQHYRWHIGSNSSFGGDCEFSNGAYYVSQSKSHRTHLCNTSSSFANFAFEVQMSIINGDCGGIVFRDGGSSGKDYIFKVCQNGCYYLYIYSDNNHDTILKSGCLSANLNQSNTIAVIANGSDIELYISEQEVTSVNDGTYSEGFIGLIAADETNTTEVAYTNARVWKL